MPYTHHLRNNGSALALFALGAISAFVSSALPSIALADSPIVAERVGMSGERLALLDNNLERYNEDSRLAGQVYIVLRHGEVVAHEANGMQDVARGVAMNTDSIFRIASQTKAITSLAIMMLQERGLLDINQPLSKYLPEWSNMQVAVSDDSGGYTLQQANL